MNHLASYDFEVNDYFSEDHQSSLKSEVTPEERGFVRYTKNNGETSYNFNANKFSEYLQKCIIGVQDENDNLYLYNQKGHYRMAESWLVGKLVKTLMCQTEALWKPSYEKMGIEAYRRDLRKMVVQFNHSDKINLQNGVLNLDTMELEPHTPEFLTTVLIPFDYDPNAQCSRFLKFIEEITENDQELGAVIQEMVGYCLCHNTKAEKAFYLFGTGNNGKSVLAKVIEQLVGQENTSHVPLGKFGENFGLASMLNKNVNIASENELSTKLNSESFKSIVSGDAMSIARKYKEDVHCVLSCKLVMLLNSLPDTADVTLGYFRKVLIIPFNHTFTEQEVDKHLFDKLLLEMPGILNWALEGLKRLKQNNYKFSKSSQTEKVTQRYMEEQNPVGVFFRETYEKAPDGQIKRSDIYAAYQGWCCNNGLEVFNRSDFWKKLKIKSGEVGSDIVLDYKRINGADYLKGYKKTKRTLNLSISDNSSHRRLGYGAALNLRQEVISIEALNMSDARTKRYWF